MNRNTLVMLGARTERARILSILEFEASMIQIDISVARKQADANRVDRLAAQQVLLRKMINAIQEGREADYSALESTTGDEGKVA